jgi:3-methyl-2-oxobutanoate hydroxymethyltransferase
VPVQGHAGLVPRKSTWTGGLRAVGKTLEQARAILAYMKNLEAAGAWAVECEVIPARVMDLLSRHTSLVTVSLGSGPGGDVQYLFAEDILGESATPPRHARIYRNFHQKRLEMQSERIAAFREFADDVRGGAFPGPGQLVDVDESVVSGLQQLLGER